MDPNGRTRKGRRRRMNSATRACSRFLSLAPFEGSGLSDSLSGTVPLRDAVLAQAPFEGPGLALLPFEGFSARLSGARSPAPALILTKPTLRHGMEPAGDRPAAGRWEPIRPSRTTIEAQIPHDPCAGPAPARPNVDLCSGFCAQRIPAPAFHCPCMDPRYAVMQ